MYMTPKLSNNLTNGVPEMSRAKLQIQAEAYNKCMDKITTFSRILIEIFIITFKSSRTSSRMLMFKQILIA